MFKRIIAALALFIPGSASAVEEPNYTVTAEHPTFEVRAYASTIHARTAVPTGGGESRSAGFRALAGYIFGGNAEKQKVAMTAPVIQSPTDDGDWEVVFIMPSKHTMDTLPTPSRNNVELTEVPGLRVAAVRFSGVAGQDEMFEAERDLREAATEQGYTIVGDAMWAWYNPPWTPGFFRRNEVLLPIE